MRYGLARPTASGWRRRRRCCTVVGMSDTISGSIGDPTASDPDFPTDPETEEPETPEGEQGAEDDGDVEPEEFQSPT